MDKTKKCTICGKTIEGYGNNAEPIRKGMCCDECNINVVIPYRIMMLRRVYEKKN